MSKKILAIALFAVMVLSLVPSVGAAVNPSITKVEIVNITTAGTPPNNYVNTADGTIGGSGEWAAVPLKTLLSASPDDGTIYSVATSYSAEKKSRLGAHAYDETPIYKATIIFGADMSTCDVRINGQVAQLAANGLSATVYFVPKKGGTTEQSYTIHIDNKAGATLTKTFTIRFTDTDTAGKIEDAIELTFAANLPAADIGKYSIKLINGVVFIDYDQSLDLTALASVPVKIGVKQNGANISPNQMLKVSLPSGATAVNNFFFPAGNPMPLFFASDKTLDFNFNASASGGMQSSLQLIVEGESRVYTSPKYPVVWRAVPKNTITQATFETDITLKVGESQTISLSDLNASTYSDGDVRFSYAQPSTAFVIEGKKITGLQVGTANILVEARNTYTTDWSWKTIGVINVKVVAANAVVDASSYRVIARTLNVRSGPGTGYGIVGTVSMNTLLTVESVANGWAKLSNGTYVSAQYIVAVNAIGAAGNYTVTASTLNVRSAPNGAIVGKLVKNTVVTVTSVSNGWALLSNGTYVSATYLK